MGCLSPVSISQRLHFITVSFCIKCLKMLSMVKPTSVNYELINFFPYSVSFACEIFAF